MSRTAEWRMPLWTLKQQSNACANWSAVQAEFTNDKIHLQIVRAIQCALLKPGGSLSKGQKNGNVRIGCHKICARTFRQAP